MFDALQNVTLGLSQLLMQSGYLSNRNNLIFSVVTFIVNSVPFVVQLPLFLGECIYAWSYLIGLGIQGLYFDLLGGYCWVINTTAQTRSTALLRVPEAFEGLVPLLVAYYRLLATDDSFSGTFHRRNVSLPIWLCGTEEQCKDFKRQMWLEQMVTKRIAEEQFVRALNRHIDVTDIKVDYNSLLKGKMLSKSVRSGTVMALFYQLRSKPYTSRAMEPGRAASYAPMSTSAMEHMSTFVPEADSPMPDEADNFGTPSRFYFSTMPYEFYASTTPKAADLETMSAPDASTPGPQRELGYHVLLVPSNDRNVKATTDFQGTCDISSAVEFCKLIEILDDDAFLVSKRPSFQFNETFQCERFDTFVDAILHKHQKIMAIYVRQAFYV